MLTSIELKRFKSICNDSPIPLENFSILCGSNSSGKSSLIQAILFLSQSFASRYDRTSFVLNGNLAKLGSFADIKSYFTEDEDFEISFSLGLNHNTWYADGLEHAKTIEAKFLLGKRNGKDASLEDELHPVIIESDIKILIVKDGQESWDRLRIRDAASFEAEAQNTNDQLYNIVEIESSEFAELRNKYPGFKPKGMKKDGFLPTSLVFEYDLTSRISRESVRAMSIPPYEYTVLTKMAAESQDSVTIPAAVFVKIKQLISEEQLRIKLDYKVPDALLKVLKSNAQLKKNINLEDFIKQDIHSKFPLNPDLLDHALLKEQKVNVRTWHTFVRTLPDATRAELYQFIKKNLNPLSISWYESSAKVKSTDSSILKSFRMLERYVNYYFSRSVKYLGPLRNEPQAIYPTIGMANPRSIGLKGENTAAVLHINEKRMITYYSPQQQEGGGISLVRLDAQLIDACKDWLSFLGVVDDYQTADTGKLGYELKVKTNPSDTVWQDLTHVGVGVSQVLPIVLMALLSDNDDLLIFEQPELHLHPKVQSRLCDFFIAMSMDNRQCLIETHSEYIITRLRSRIAQAENTKLKDISSIFFVDKLNGISTFSKVDVSRFGAIENWPKDFFDDSNREVEIIIREAAKKRKKEQVEKMRILKDKGGE